MIDYRLKITIAKSIKKNKIYEMALNLAIFSFLQLRRSPDADEVVDEMVDDLSLVDWVVLVSSGAAFGAEFGAYVPLRLWRLVRSLKRRRTS